LAVSAVSNCEKGLQPWGQVLPCDKNYLTA
jgi:secreted PhoX family phosphatase